MAPTIIATSRHLMLQQQSGKPVSQHRIQISSDSCISPNKLRQQQTVPAQSTSRLSHHNTQVLPHQLITATPTLCNNGQIFRDEPALVCNANFSRNEEKVLPKPSYSYACLIALALKNSSSGTLQVSEIYNFMCKYFPYFRTAPKGWKNTVRHNLSLNKCFEKIKTTFFSSNNQRKGCLWALNPDKVHKIDEEIKKISKKDLQAIRDAMDTPDVLSALECGEMKFEDMSSMSLCSKDKNEDEEVDPLMLTEPLPPPRGTFKFVAVLRTGADEQHQVATTGVKNSHGANTGLTVLRPVLHNRNLVTWNSSSAAAMGPVIMVKSIHLMPQQQSGKLVSQHRLQISSNRSISPSNLRQQQTVVAQSTGRLGQHNTQVVTHQPITAVPTSCNNGQIFRGTSALVHNANLRRNEEEVLPKPSYTYSCLIALALKNSSSGSLPMSEIYRFVCKYFPYFRTARNDWKNSVRKNLRNNKCFEKIKKPFFFGNNQRNRCLWSLNPNKVHEMDKKIKSRNKKYLQGIRDAMNTPDILGALERGEMKFEATSSTSSCSEDEDEEEEVDPLMLTEPPPPTLATLKFVGSSESMAEADRQHRGAITGVTVLQGGKTVGQQTTILRANGGSGQQHHQFISAEMRPETVFASAVTSSPARSEPEYILPDLTTPGNSFQSNWALLDDLGNETTLEEYLSSSSVVSSSNCIPTSAAVGVVSSP